MKQWLDEEFEASLDWHKNIEGMIRKAATIARKFWKEIQAAEDAAAFDEDEDDRSPANSDESEGESVSNSGM